jgi:hypothetical protein
MKIIVIRLWQVKNDVSSCLHLLICGISSKLPVKNKFNNYSNILYSYNRITIRYILYSLNALVDNDFIIYDRKAL